LVVAGQKSDKGKTTKKKSGGMMGLVSKILAVSAIAFAAVFFAAMFDVGHIGLHSKLKGVAIGLVPLYAALAIAALFLGPKPGADADAQASQIAALTDFQSKVTSQIIALQNQLDSFSGQDMESLKARNQELQAELDAIHQAERDKVDGEIEALRLRNEALEEQIKKWAFEAVDKTVNGEKVEPMKAA
jgi:gas vesicle protein